ncbi:TPA: leucine-rich repeat domain-containing protein [Escherichia coli]|nr:leucine-rich repeat domain-containing protein [Escherichia coli]
MIPSNDLFLKVQSVQFKKITSNAEPTTEQHWVATYDIFIDEFINELATSLLCSEFTPINQNGRLLRILSGFKFVSEEHFKWHNYSIRIGYDISEYMGYVTIERSQGAGALPSLYKLEFISSNIAELQSQLIDLSVQHLCKDMRVWAESVKADASDVVKNNVDIALDRMLLCCKDRQKTLDLSNLQLSSLPPLPEWIEKLSVSNNKLTKIQVPVLCKKLSASFNKLTVFPEVPDNIIQISVTNNKISYIDSFPSKAEIILIGHNYLSEIPAIPDATMVFDCSYNNIKKIHYFPENLESVSIGHNRIQALPKLGRKLKKLSAEDNPIIEKFIIPSTLEKISLDSSQKKYCSGTYFPGDDSN